jgi:hypothetical protein
VQGGIREARDERAVGNPCTERVADTLSRQAGENNGARLISCIDSLWDFYIIRLGGEISAKAYSKFIFYINLQVKEFY